MLVTTALQDTFGFQEGETALEEVGLLERSEETDCWPDQFAAETTKPSRGPENSPTRTSDIDRYFLGFLNTLRQRRTSQHNGTKAFPALRLRPILVHWDYRSVKASG